MSPRYKRRGAEVVYADHEEAPSQLNSQPYPRRLDAKKLELWLDETPSGVERLKVG